MLETDRRVLGNLSEPVSLHVLTERAMADAHGPFDSTEGFDSVRDDVDKILTKLVRRRLVVNVGRHSDAKSLLRSVAASSDAIDLPKPKADSLRERLDAGRDSRRLNTGDLYVMSKAGFDALHEPLT